MLMILDVYSCKTASEICEKNKIKLPVDLKLQISIETIDDEIQMLYVPNPSFSSFHSVEPMCKCYYMTGTLEEVVKRINDEEASVLSIYKK